VTNTESGIISGTLSADVEWIEITPTSFSSTSSDITFTAQSQWFQLYGENTGIISITSDGGNTSLSVTVNHIKPWAIWDIFEPMGCVPNNNNPDYQPK